MIQNAEYQDIIDKINKIRSFGLNKMVTIPQIAILGDQSSGKSSVLEAITKLSFPRNIETCTRFATQVSLRQGDTHHMSASIDGESEFNDKYRTHDSNWDVHDAVTAANEILCANSEISEKVLEITISGPTLSPLTIIDLPGYINTTIDGQDKTIVQTIRTINTRYIKDNRTIILAVVPANVDLNNIFVLGEAERYDQNNERTIPIVTKPDAIEQDLLPNLIQTIMNKRKFMKLGYLVMRNSSYKDIDMPWDDARQLEEEFFKSSPLWLQVPDANKGRVSVKTFLGELLYNHIKKELPFLKKDILDLVFKCDKEIADLGSPVSSIVMAKTKYFDSIVKLRTSLIALLDGDYSFDYISQYKSDFQKQSSVTTDKDNDVGLFGDANDADDADDCEPLSLESESDYRFIRSSLYRLYQRYNVVMNKDKYMLPKDKINDLVLRYKGSELPGFISFTTFTKIYMETLFRWRDITKGHVFNIHQFLYKAINRFITFSSDPLIKDTLLFEFDKFYNSQITKIETEIDNIFTDERTPFTMNKYYYDNILKSRKASAEEQIQRLVNKIHTQYNSTGEQVRATLREHLNSFGHVTRISDVDYNEQLAIEDMQEQMKSYCKVARKRIVDVLLLQTIERHLIKSIHLYFDMLIAVDDNTISRLIESPAKQARRKELDQRVDVLRRSLLEL
ncbi:P-loop containing nucleoside triphosphate hydrolase protein [Linnemannia elongata]|nr:P-loop containing nucleoside triphosphate hydrolase protein [Linnemannia elongata]